MLCECGCRKSAGAARCRPCEDAARRAPACTCRQCGMSFKRRQRARDANIFCSRRCAGAWRTAHKAQARVCLVPVRSCVECGASFTGRSVVCGRACRKKIAARRYVLTQRDKKRQYYIARRGILPRYQSTCERASVFEHIGGRRRKFCSAACSNNAHGGSHCQRAKRLGLPRDWSIRNVDVLRRDGWHCMLCGRSTPERLRGTFRPNAPEVDHIVPLSAGGGHVWSNLQCACRECNIKKGAKPLGQLRVAC